MKLELIIPILSIILGALSTGIPIAFKLFKAIKAKSVADMVEYAKMLITDAENAFKAFDKVMKAQNSSAGAMKKKSVMTDLQAFAISKGYKFDAAFWSEKIDELVTFTKSVNAK